MGTMGIMRTMGTTGIMGIMGVMGKRQRGSASEGLCRDIQLMGWLRLSSIDHI